MGRPLGYRKSTAEYREQYPLVILALQNGMSLRKTAELCGHSINTIRKIKAMRL